MRSFLACLAAVASLAASLAGCSTNAATGKSSLMLLSREDEIALGAEAAPQMTEEFGGNVANDRLQKYVARIGASMAKETEAYNPTLPWEFTLLNSDVVNAFALPGGKVFITRGLASQLTTEAQMAGVLGHEIGHVTAQHGNQRISQQMGFNVILAGLAIGVAGADDDSAVRKYGQFAVPALAIGGNVVLLSYGRDQELEADRLGMRYMSNVGYNPRGQLEVMELLGRLSKGPRQPELLATHPDPAARQEQIKKLLTGEYASTQGNANYKEFKERYKAEFLDTLAKVPPAPKPKAALDGSRARFAAVAHPGGWCATCTGAGGSRSLAVAEDAGPVPPREGVYRFIAPAAGR